MRRPYILFRRSAGARDGKVYYVGYWDPERQEYRRRSTGHTNKADADAQARKWLEEGVLSCSVTLHDYLVGFWAADSDYMRSRALRGRSLSEGYRAGMHGAVGKYVLPWLIGRKRQRMALPDVTPALLERMLLDLHGSGLSPRRVNVVRQAVGVALSEARRLGLIRHNPILEVLRLAEPKRQREILSLEEARAVLAGPWPGSPCWSWRWPVPWPGRLANMLAAATGLRLGEIRGLQIEDLVQDGAQWCIVVRHNWQDEEQRLKAPKWGSARRVPVPGRLAQELRQLAAGNPWGNGFIFWGPRREAPVGKRPLEEAFNAAVRAAGIAEEERRRRGLTFHAWRHWYVAMIRGAIPDHAVQQLTGHRSERLLDHYTHLTEEQLQAVLRRAEGMMGSSGQAAEQE